MSFTVFLLILVTFLNSYNSTFAVPIGHPSNNQDPEHKSQNGPTVNINIEKPDPKSKGIDEPSDQKVPKDSPPLKQPEAVNKDVADTIKAKDAADTSKAKDADTIKAKDEPAHNLNTEFNSHKKPIHTNATEMDSSTLKRLVLVLVGISVLFMMYLAYKTYSRKRGKSPAIVLKYGVRTRRSDLEMRPLPLEEDEDDETVFDLGNVNNR